MEAVGFQTQQNGLTTKSEVRVVLTLTLSLPGIFVRPPVKRGISHKFLVTIIFFNCAPSKYVVELLS